MNTNQKIAELENQLTAIQQELDKLKRDEAEETWPKVGDTYHVISANGDIRNYTYDGENFDTNVKSINNMFRTVEEAEKELDARKVIAELRSQPGSRKFVVGEENYSTVACLYDGAVVINYWATDSNGFGQAYFNAEEDVKNAIKAVGEDRILAAAKWLAMGV